MTGKLFATMHKDQNEVIRYPISEASNGFPQVTSTRSHRVT